MEGVKLSADGHSGAVAGKVPLGQQEWNAVLLVELN